MSRNNVVIGAVAVLVSLAISVTVSILLFRETTMDDAPRSEPEQPQVYDSHEEACRAILSDPDLSGEATSLHSAEADNDYLGKKLVRPGKSQGSVNGVGLERCGDHWVVMILVQDREVTVPSEGPRGIPVIAIKAGPFYGG